jgi:hypothetical protein
MSASSAERIGASESPAPAQLYVINLAASTSPMALSHPSSPALKRFTFFVSRQREEGRERFRLHMGYFQTQEQAEELLPSVREVYPGAWAGPAPTTGTGRRGRIAAGSVVPAAAPPAVAAVMAQQAAATPAAPAASAPVAAPAPVAAVPGPAPAMPAPGPAPAQAAHPIPAAPSIESMSNVRDVLAQLSEDAPQAPLSIDLPAPAEPAASAAPAAELSGMEALSLLEPPAAAQPAPVVPSLPPLKNPFEGLDREPQVRLVTPEDTQTLTDIKVDRENNAPPCFAVQLVWSTTPVDVSALPHLAIFEAYTLYNVEGNRQGRKWYGLRLGFFSDPNSATQVANYVRSDYKTVAVVPVAVKERDRARGTTTPPPAEPEKTTDADLRRERMEGFELLPDDRPPPPRRDIDDAAGVPAAGKRVPAPAAPPRLVPKAAAAAPAPAATPGKATGRPTGKRVVARRRAPDVPLDRKVSTGVGGAEVLESTLEILGASTLSLDDGGRTIVNDAAARKPVEKKPGSRFARLLSRLGGH